MGKNEKLAFAIVTVLLVIVLLVFVGRLQSANEAARVYRVSVITDEINPEYAVNCKKGLDRAARDYNVDLQMIILHEGMTIAQQKASLQKELDAGSDAIILSVRGETEIVNWLENGTLAIPLIAMDMKGEGKLFAYRVYSDDFLMGATLAKEILKDGAQRCQVRYCRESDRTRQRYAGLQSVLEAAGVPLHTEGDPTAPQWISMQRDDFVAALDEDALIKLSGNSLEREIRLYGIGSTNEILNAMENGSVTRLVVEDDYAMGYLALRGAIRAVQGQTETGEDVLNSYVADGKQLFEEPLQHILFPIG